MYLAMPYTELRDTILSLALGGSCNKNKILCNYFPKYSEVWFLFIYWVMNHKICVYLTHLHNTYTDALSKADLLLVIKLRIHLLLVCPTLSNPLLLFCSFLHLYHLAHQQKETYPRKKRLLWANDGSKWDKRAANESLVISWRTGI